MANFEIGDRVEAGEGADYDAGRIVAIDLPGVNADIAWDSGVRTFCRIADLRAEGESVHCECGEITGERCAWHGPESSTVVVEWMPVYLRDSHAAAGNRGSYPANGAKRVRCERSCAETIVESDPDWASIVD